jgi:hypothetical protein
MTAGKRVEAADLFAGLYANWTPEQIDANRRANIRRDSELWALNNGNPAATRYQVRLVTGGDLRGMRRAWRRVFRAPGGRLYVNAGNGTAAARRYLSADVRKLVESVGA